MRETQFNSDVNADKSYLSWIVDLAKRYRTSQIKAATKVNEDMLRFYWSVGEDIEKKQLENLYGSHFYENLSKDLKHELGLKQGLSPSTLKYMRYFYQLYSQLVENRQQDADDFNCIFKIPWTHHIFRSEVLREQLGAWGSLELSVLRLVRAPRGRSDKLFTNSSFFRKRTCRRTPEKPI